MQYLLLLLALLGLADASYLTYEHFSNIIVPCSNNIFIDCGAVLGSSYSMVFGVPLATLGVVHYGLLTVFVLLAIFNKKRIWKFIILLQLSFGLLVSSYLIYIQLVVIGSICLYCMGSAVVSILLFILTWKVFIHARQIVFIRLTGMIYHYIIKPILFLIDPEKVHNSTTKMGERFGESGIVKAVLRFAYNFMDPLLEQRLTGIKFTNPVGLAAGFDYEAKFTQILPSLGFGYQAVGSITNLPYEGNPKPQLGRLPKSKSLLVNKGFKSTGAKNVSEYLRTKKFKIPVGVSIGRTNSADLITQADSVKDIVSAFRVFEKKRVKNAYYELNISCPNLIHGNVSFYLPKNLEELLVAVDKLKLKKPVYIKMPIDRTDRQITEMLKVIDKSSVKGLIFGNLQKDKKHPSLDKEEVKKFKMGFYSGKPTYERSNELIELAYKKYKDRFVVVGCGGVFSAEDAWEKIIRGASLIQLITGLVYQGPQLVAEINYKLVEKCKVEGYGNIKEAVGAKV